MQVIHDRTATNDVHLRRTLYLTIMSSAGYEEAGHKLMKMGLQPVQEPELVRMIIDCCSQERTFLRFYALLAQRFCVKFFSYACAPCSSRCCPLLHYRLLVGAAHYARLRARAPDWSGLVGAMLYTSVSNRMNLLLAMRRPASCRQRCAQGMSASPCMLKW